MKIFVINLDTATGRWKNYEDDLRYTRWSATSIDDLSCDHPIYENMVSYWNVDPREHKAKCCCSLNQSDT